MPLKHDFLIFTGTETQWHPWSISICTIGPIDEIQMTSWLTWSPPHTIHSILTHYLLLYSSWKGFYVISNNFAKTLLLNCSSDTCAPHGVVLCGAVILDTLSVSQALLNCISYNSAWLIFFFAIIGFNYPPTLLNRVCQLVWIPYCIC